jgi:hypothetical protein
LPPAAPQHARPPRLDRGQSRAALAALGALAALAGALSGCTTGSAGSGDTVSPPPISPAPSLTAITPSATPPAPDTGAPASTAGAPETSAPATGSPSTSAPHSTTAASSTAASGRKSSSPPRKQVTLVVTYSGWNAGARTAEVDAFAPRVLATHATCTLTMSLAGVSRTASRRASVGPSSTQCGALTIAGSKLSPGSWRAIVHFSSSDVVGDSNPVTIKVPR